MDTVPRRSERQFFYQHGLVACAVKFTSDMLEDDIIQHISKQFPVVESSILFSKFSFLKAVDDLLIEPDIECWDYSTVRHVAIQGSIYKKLKFKGDLFDDDSDSEDNEIHFPSVAAYKKEGLLKSNSNTEKNKVISSSAMTRGYEGKKSCTTSSSKTNRTIDQCFQKKPMVECPVCFKKFSVLFTEEQASDCSSKFDVLYVNSADEMEDGKIDINDVTVPYGREEEEVENGIQEDIEADTVTNDLRKKNYSFLESILLTYEEDMLGPIFAHFYQSLGLLQNINVWL